MNKIFTRTVRKYIYGVCIAAVPVLIYVGWLPAEAAPIILPLVLALLNLSPEEALTPEDQPL
jgi:hypothetical protein